jgi:hypothetical protein
MTLKEIKAAKNYELITWISRFCSWSKITKADQKLAIRIIEELEKRGIIEDINEYMLMNRMMFRRDSMPEKYAFIFD